MGWGGLSCFPRSPGGGWLWLLTSRPLQAIESFALMVKQTAQRLQSFGTELAETELPNDVPATSAVLSTHTHKRDQAKVGCVGQGAVWSPKRIRPCGVLGHVTSLSLLTGPHSAPALLCLASKCSSQRHPVHSMVPHVAALCMWPQDCPSGLGMAPTPADMVLSCRRR